MTIRQVMSPPPLTEADLTPGRYADHAFIGRVASLTAWFILGLCTSVLPLLRRNPTANSLSSRTLDLLHRSDWLRILGFGIIIPVIYYFLITRLTPLGAREFSARMTGFIMPACQFAGLLLLTLVLPTVIAASRLEKRGAFLGLTARRPWTGKLAAASAFIAIPASGPLFHRSSILHPDYIYILLAIPTFWLLSGFIRGLSNKPPHALRRATLSRTLQPAWLLGILVFAISIPLHHAEERHWIPQETLFSVSPEKPGLRYEYDLTQACRAELLDHIRRAQSPE